MDRSIAQALARFRLRRKFGAAADAPPKAPKKRPSLPRKARSPGVDFSSAGDSDRRLWVLNDEPLYNAWQASGEPLERWIATHRKQIDGKRRAARGPRTVRITVKRAPARKAPKQAAKRAKAPRKVGRYRLQEKHQGKWATVEHFTHAADARAAYKRAVQSGKGREGYRLVSPAGKVLGRAKAKSATRKAPKRSPKKRATTKRTKRTTKRATKRTRKAPKRSPKKRATKKRTKRTRKG